MPAVSGPACCRAWARRRINFLLSLLILTTIVGLPGLTGCERSPVAAPTTAPSGTDAATPAVTSSDPAPEPSPSHVTINQRRYTFPPAKLQLQTKDGSVTALLYSDDPPTAIDDNYAGNSYYLAVPLELTELTDVKELNAATWRYRAPTSDRTDTLYGIFLEGARVQLQPIDVSVQFQVDAEGEQRTIVVWLAGTFKMYDTLAAHDVGDLVPVAAKLMPTLEQRRRRSKDIDLPSTPTQPLLPTTEAAKG